MTFTLPSKTAAEARAATLSRTSQYPNIEYRAAIYPDGQCHRELWQWGVARYELDYGPKGEERFLGFLWEASR